MPGLPRCARANGQVDGQRVGSSSRNCGWLCTREGIEALSLGCSPSSPPGSGNSGGNTGRQAGRWGPDAQPACKRTGLEPRGKPAPNCLETAAPPRGSLLVCQSPRVISLLQGPLSASGDSCLLFSEVPPSVTVPYRPLTNRKKKKHSALPKVNYYYEIQSGIRGLNNDECLSNNLEGKILQRFLNFQSAVDRHFYKIQ